VNNRDRKLLGTRGTKGSIVSISFVVLVSGSSTLDIFFLIVCIWIESSNWKLAKKQGFLHSMYWLSHWIRGGLIA